VDLDDRKLQLAREFGATQGLNASEGDTANAIWEINPGGVDYAFDAVGAMETALQILHAVRQGGPRADNQGGMAVLVGIPVADVSFDLNDILLYQRHYCGSLGSTEPDADFPLFLVWMREDKVSPREAGDQPIFLGTDRGSPGCVGGGTDSGPRHH
jgi:Zn-dependent alcohol dehydrogenase